MRRRHAGENLEGELQRKKEFGTARLGSEVDAEDSGLGLEVHNNLTKLIDSFDFLIRLGGIAENEKVSRTKLSD